MSSLSKVCLLVTNNMCTHFTATSSCPQQDWNYSRKSLGKLSLLFILLLLFLTSFPGPFLPLLQAYILCKNCRRMSFLFLSPFFFRSKENCPYPPSTTSLIYQFLCFISQQKILSLTEKLCTFLTLYSIISISLFISF